MTTDNRFATLPAFIARRRWWLLPLAIWAAIVGISLQGQLGDLHRQSFTVTAEGARNMFRMVVLTRAWNAQHGGVYVPVTESIQPNPYLEHPRRDLVTTSGLKLTMINPAFMTRLLSELAEQQQDAAFHITSLKPIRPANAPDDWERLALQGFEAGDKERIEILPGRKGNELRYMAPLIVAKPCLACHEKQGYKEGDIRGGISVSLPFAPVEAAMQPAQRQTIRMHLSIFGLVALLGGLLLETLRRRWLALAETIADLDHTRHALEESNRELARARDAADAANVAKSTFLANMSHEIRTPMNAIIGLTHLTLKSELGTTQRNYLQKIQGASKHLLGVINDILDFSKIEANKLSIEQREFDLDELFDNIASQLGEKVASKNLELVIDIDPEAPHMLVGDELRLGQILLNLGSNAVKFTEHGEIDIVVRCQESAADGITLEFTVIDSGIGLTEEQIGRLFTSFEQADNSITRKYGGTGLGLAISKRLVELMGGRIGVTSTPGAGAQFRFTARFGIGTGQARRRLPTPDLRGRRILVVDDNENAREVSGALLRSMTFEVGLAASGSAGVEEVRRADAAGSPYEVVFLDWQMPDMDGLATARAISALPLAHRPALVMVTAYGRDDLLDQARAAGVVDVYGKPVTASTLFDAVINVLGPQDARAPLRLPGGDAELAAIAGARVLLVEDNPLNQEVGSALLEEVGLRVDIAENGAVALDRLAISDYDLVLMDMQMPVMDGLTATEALRQQRRYDALPVVAMTANAMSTDRDRCLAAGMNDHLAKPIDPDALLATLKRWIKPGPRAVPTASPAAAAAPAPAGQAAGLAASLADIVGLDVAFGLRLARGREKLYLRLLRQYVAGQQDFVAQMDAALARGDRPTAVRLAHTLKGVSGQIGAQTLRSLAELLEHAILENEPAPVFDSLKAQIGEMLDTLIRDLRARLPAAPEAPAATAVAVAPQQLQTLCQELAAQLAAADFTAGKTLAQHHDLLQAGLGAHYPRLQSLVEGFEFELAADTLRKALAENCDVAAPSPRRTP